MSEPFAIVGSLYRLRVDWFRPDTKRVFEEVNPDYEAGAKARYDAYVESLADYKAIPSLDPWSWDDLPPIPKAKFRRDAKVTIDAAIRHE